MKSLTKITSLGLLLLLANQATEAAPITWTDTIRFNPTAYISQWNAGLQPSAEAVASFPLQSSLLNSAGVDSPALATAPENDGRLQSSGIVSLLDKDRDKADHPEHKPKPKPKPGSVPEPGALGLIGLGVLALSFMRRRARLNAADTDEGSRVAG